MKQSVSSKIVGALLCAVFHSPLVNNATFSGNVGKKTKDKKSHYRPSKGFRYNVFPVEQAKAEVLIPTERNCDKVILMLHGGSFKVKLLDMYRHLAEKYSRLLDHCAVVSVDYRVFPEHPYPAQREDVLVVYHAMLAHGVKPEQIAMIGDSAGANLALSACLYLRDHALPLPGAIVCFSLWGDMTNSGDSFIRNCYTDPFNGIAKRKDPADHIDYLRRISAYAEKLDRADVYVSPSFADFSGFPPVTLFCGTAEMDESDTDLAFENMKKAGVDVKMYKYEGMFHDFQLVPFFPESRDVFRKVKTRLS